MKFNFILLILFIFQFFYAQGLDKKWELSTNKSQFIELKEGTFTCKISGDSLLTSGDYLVQGNQLFLYDKNSDTPSKRMTIKTQNDSILVLENKGVTYFYKNSRPVKNVKTGKDTISSPQKISVESFIRGILGIVVLIFIAFLFSSNKKAIPWKTVGLGLLAQLLLAIGILKVPFVQKIFDFGGKMFTKVLEFTKEGSIFLMGGMMDTNSYGFIFAFQVLPTIIFFSALTSLLFYLGIIQKVVELLAIALTKLLRISGAESLSVAGNIFLGQTEAPLLIKAYIEKMNRSEILLVMVGGMATVAGGVLAAYIGFLGGGDKAMEAVFARHLLAASVMAAPGAVIIAKILLPQTENIVTDVNVSKEKIGSNILDAIASGTSEGLKLAANVAAMLLVFVALIAMLNYGLDKVGALTGLNEVIANNTQYNNFSIQTILGIIFAPLMWLIGVAREDIMPMGQLLGIKLAASEFVAYIELAELKNTANALHLTYEKSVIMATYMLCGFANFASIGIQIGGIGSLAPNQRKNLSELGLKAVIGGSLASLLSATIAGMLLG